VEKYCASQDKEVKKLTRRVRRKYMDNIAGEAQSVADLGNIKGVFDSMKR
jgi:hypothetical protein